MMEPYDRMMLDNSPRGEASQKPTRLETTEAFKKPASKDEQGYSPLTSARASASASPPLKNTGMVTYRVRFGPSSGILLTGTDPLLLLDEMRSLGVINPLNCYVSWDIIVIADKGTDAVRAERKKLGQILIERGDITESALQQVLKEKKYIGEMLVEKGLVTPDKVESALIEQQRVRKVREKLETRDEEIVSI